MKLPMIVSLHTSILTGYSSGDDNLFSLALFMVFITHRYTNRLCPLAYSNGNENCSLPKRVMPINGLIVSNKITTEWDFQCADNKCSYWLRYTFLQVSQQNHGWNENFNLLVVNTFLTVDCLLFYQWNNEQN